MSLPPQVKPSGRESFANAEVGQEQRKVERRVLGVVTGAELPVRRIGGEVN